MNITHLRRDYTVGALDRKDLDADPIQQFRRWLQVALEAQLPEPYAMTFATADRLGRPSARILLLRAADERGFSFYTNYESRKGQELIDNPHGALVFYWAELERQVCATGEVTRLSRKESEDYFKIRPRESRLAAWASRQSETLASRAVLEERYRHFEREYPDENVPIPPHWGGLVLRPARIEFWQGRPSRLHDRFAYTRQPDNSWRIERLSP
ncbi:MAG: pyridoxamine 5'-phosphate oxidase [Verrucomicrobia bacterium]|nr:pyridoxamine 5'-phosphate oxidase [Verrucomicrobiota bacterium]